MVRPRQPHHPTHLNRAVRSDLAWWSVFLEQWNGVSMLWDYSKGEGDSQVVSDASGAWGCGALYVVKQVDSVPVDHRLHS